MPFPRLLLFKANNIPFFVGFVVILAFSVFLSLVGNSSLLRDADTTEKENVTTNDVANTTKPTLILHVGPHKTGTTTM